MIRRSKPEEIEAIVMLCKKFYPMTPYAATYPFDYDTVYELTEKLVHEDTVFIAEEDGKPVGILGLAIVPFMFNANMLEAHEVIWWVLPKAQAMGVGEALLQAADVLFQERGIVSINMARMANSPGHAKTVLERNGHVETYISHKKVLKWPQSPQQ